MNGKRLVQELVEIAGGQAALARAIGVKQGNVWNWLHRDGAIPPDQVIAASRAIGWKKTPHQIAPSLYPNPADGLPPDLRPKTEAKARIKKVQTAA